MSAAVPDLGEQAFGSDRLTLRPACALLAATFLLVLLCGLPGALSFMLVLIVFVGAPLILICFCCLAMLRWWRGRRRAALSLLLAVAAPALFFQPIVWLADCAHVGLTMGFGIGEWGPSHIAENGRFQARDWSVGLAGGPATFLIYDATDQIARPPHDRHGFTCTWPPRHLFGHYYICRF